MDARASAASSRESGMKRHLWVLVASALVATSCGGGTATLIEDSAGSAGQQVEEPTLNQAEPPAPPVPTAVTAAEPTATPVPPTAEPTAADQPLSLLDGFRVGDCFNNAGTVDGEDTPTSPVDCNAEHEYEVFYVGETGDGLDAPHRFGVDFTDSLFSTSCAPATIEFGGAPWDVLPFGTRVWTPREVDWVAGDRTFLCTAEAGLRNENPFKVGTAAGGTLVSDEGVVARATVGVQRDLFFSFQRSKLYPLTGGEFELPNLSPSVLTAGFLFGSPLQDSEGDGSRTYDYNFDTGAVTQLETGLEGWELASPLFVLDIPAFVFAGRETKADDWDLYQSRTGQEPLRLTDAPGDDHWPTLTPDQSQIVYHSAGDIWSMNVDGSNKRQLTTDPAGDFESAVSPDGAKIVFASDRSGNDDIWIMNSDGSDQQNLTNHPAAEAWPFFSGDGNVIYFQSDRLGVQSNIMMMELDGSNQSYYSFEFMTNAALLPDAITTRLATDLPTITEVLTSTVAGIVPGAEGDLTEVSHSSGRLIPSLPAGWEYEEIGGDDPASMVAAPSISAFNDTWDTDGVLITLIEASSEADVVARVDATAAANDSSCDLDDQSTSVTGELVTLARRFRCGTDNIAWVVGAFNSDTKVGVLFEGQWDANPSAEADEALINEIGELLVWG